MRGIDLTRIESRPIKDRHAEYWFHIDCTGHVAEPAMGEALAALHRRCDRVRFLGSYPRAGNGPAAGAGTAPRRSAARAPTRFAAARSGSTGCAPGTSAEARPGPARADRVQRGTGPRLPPARAPRWTSSAARRPRRWADGSRRWPVTAVFASRAVRAQQTAAPVAAAHGLPVDGRSTGCTRCPAATWRAAPTPTPASGSTTSTRRGAAASLDARLPGGESARDVRARFLPGRRGGSRGRDRRRWCWSATARRSGWPRAPCSARAAETRYVPNTGLVVLRPGPAGTWDLEHWDEAVPVPGDVTAGGAAAGTRG